MDFLCVSLDVVKDLALSIVLLRSRGELELLLVDHSIECHLSSHTNLAIEVKLMLLDHVGYELRAYQKGYENIPVSPILI